MLDHILQLQLKIFCNSPDLHLLDRFMFRQVKSDLRGDDYCGLDDLKKAIQHSIRLISENNQLSELEKFKIHLKDVITSGGDDISRIH